MKIISFTFLALMATLVGCSRPAQTDIHSEQPNAGPVVYSSSATFSQDVINADGIVVVDFYADWCGPCKKVAPILDTLAAEYEGKIKIVKIDVDENQKLAEEFGVRSIPSFFSFKDGNVLDGKVGAMSKKDFVDWFEETLNPS